MNKKTNSSKDETANSVVRVTTTTASASKELLNKANKIMPKLGKKIMPNDLIHFALKKITDEDLRKLKVDSLRPTDIDKILYQTFIKKKLGKNKEDFSAFTRTPDYLQFVKEHEHEYKA